MHLTHEGLSLWYETPDAPSPSDESVRREGASLTIGVQPPNPTNSVSVLYRLDGGLTKSLPTRELRTDYARDVQYFRATFPWFPSGEIVEYSPVLICAGRQVPPPEAAERFASRFKLAPVSKTTTEPLRANNAVPGQRFAPELEYLASITANLDKAEIIGETPAGIRLNYYALDGTVTGPKLNGRILPRAGDAVTVRPDGIGVIQVRATVQTNDGAMLSAEYYGTLELGPDGYKRALANQLPPYPTVCIAPRLTTGHPKYSWLNRLQCVGVGYVAISELRLEYDLFAVHPPRPPTDAGRR
jgi:hypothetical protein